MTEYFSTPYMLVIWEHGPHWIKDCHRCSNIHYNNLEFCLELHFVYFKGIVCLNVV